MRRSSGSRHYARRGRGENCSGTDPDHGLRQHNVDGTPMINVDKFPDLKWLVDYGHAKNVLMGTMFGVLMFQLGFDKPLVDKLVPFVRGLFDLFMEKDCSQVEINPLIVTEEGDLFAIDGKVNFDSNALYRLPEIAALRDPEEEDPRERAAAEIDLAYVGLDGSIGCMVNGAGLAMATLDMLRSTVGAAALGFARRATMRAQTASSRGSCASSATL